MGLESPYSLNWPMAGESSRTNTCSEVSRLHTFLFLHSPLPDYCQTPWTAGSGTLPSTLVFHHSTSTRRAVRPLRRLYSVHQTLLSTEHVAISFPIVPQHSPSSTNTQALYPRLRIFTPLIPSSPQAMASSEDVSAQLTQLATDLLSVAQAYNPSAGQTGLKSRLEVQAKAKQILNFMSEPIEEPFRLSANVRGVINAQAYTHRLDVGNEASDLTRSRRWQKSCPSAPL